MNRIPTGIGCDGIVCIRHQRHLSRPYPLDEIDKFGSGVAFDVKFGTNPRLQIENIFLTNMPFVRTRMYCNSICAKQLTIYCNLADIGKISSPRIAQCCNLVNIYTKFSHFKMNQYLYSYLITATLYGLFRNCKYKSDE